MRIFEKNDVVVGNFLTFLSTNTDKQTHRRIGEIINKTYDNELICVDICGSACGQKRFILDVFDCKSDEVYETHEEILAAYPEEFL